MNYLINIYFMCNIVLSILFLIIPIIIGAVRKGYDLDPFKRNIVLTIRPIKSIVSSILEEFDKNGLASSITCTVLVLLIGGIALIPVLIISIFSMFSKIHMLKYVLSKEERASIAVGLKKGK